MAWDLVFDQLTKDTIPDGSGSIVTTETAETQVMLQFDSEFAAWWGDQQAGSKIGRLIALGAGPAAIQAEATRALNVLASRGVIDLVSASAEESAEVRGRIRLQTTCRDATGRVLKSGAME